MTNINCSSVINCLAKELKIPVSKYSLNKYLLSHPHYPSMLSMSDALTHFKVPNIAFQKQLQDNKKIDLPFPLICRLSSHGLGQFIVVTSSTNDKIYYKDGKRGNKSIPKDDFYAEWDGIALYAEKDQESGESLYFQSQLLNFFIKIKLPLFIFVLCYFIYFFSGDQLLKAAILPILVLKIIGFVISIFLVSITLDAKNPFIENLCGIGKKNGCNKILKSSAANITDWLSWSEVGLIYFSFTMIALIIAPETSKVLSWLSLACIPYSIYSISYQLKNKNWCVLCCSIQVIIWLEVLFSFFAGTFLNFFSNANSLLIIVLSFVASSVLWALLKPFITKAYQVNFLKQELNQFKNNTLLFEKYLNLSPSIELPEDLVSIEIGNPLAKTVITMVSNLYCNPCGDAHKKLTRWLEIRDDLRLKIIFTVSSYLNDPRIKAIEHLKELSLKEENTKVILRAIEDWYSNGHKIDILQKKYPIGHNSKMPRIGPIQNEWLYQANIIRTPTFFINGKRIITPYKLDDVEHLVF
ncbi:vitamin K epoxide reductase family protein [Pedobacter sp. MW01-1-1]|uniref:vitamin K epoxide reductase family protein n=1 Tax=Pedobacter sp. MW01-1-1 TaxID=3383027 RepID=UPI003FEE6E7D